ncbi:transposase [Streptomyces sp. R28]|uniref:Transposase n=1 Tax=Streptomyces sp. R28 TaxID=3238628 RepID=A0AB39PNL4_9ACTN
MNSSVRAADALRDDVRAYVAERLGADGVLITDDTGFIKKGTTSATKGELARDIVRCCIAADLPAAWVTSDEAYGQDWHFRCLLEQLDVGYVVAVPKSQQIKSLAGMWRIDQLIEEAPVDAWQRLSCGDGAKGPRVYDWAAAKLPANLIFDPDPPTQHR